MIRCSRFQLLARRKQSAILASSHGLSRSSSIHLAAKRFLSTSTNPRAPSNTTPPSGSSSSNTNTQTPRRWPKRTLYAVLTMGVLGGTVYGVDRTYNASSVVRTGRTVWTALLIALDYKLNFKPSKSEQIPELHERVAERIYNLITANGGLYIKIGQALAANAPLLPPPLRAKFNLLFDSAPPSPLSSIHRVFESPPSQGGLGISWEDIFEVDPVTGKSGFEEPVACASVAEVFKARLKGSGEWVAVKVQREEVGRQVEWDLAAFRGVMWAMEWGFDLPVTWVVDYITHHLRLELSFLTESQNSLRTAHLISTHPTLKDRVYVPRVYEELTRDKVLVMEWVEGVRMSDLGMFGGVVGEELGRGWKAHEPEAAPSPTSSASTSSPSPSPSSSSPSASPSTAHTTSSLANLAKEQREPPFRLIGGSKAIMQTMVDLFGAQMFEWGFVHCDPHPGNIIIRPRPSPSSQTSSISSSAPQPSTPQPHQLVLLDHGLYITLPPSLRLQYAKLWASLLVFDLEGVESVAREWGFGDAGLLAGAVSLRPGWRRRGGFGASARSAGAGGTGVDAAEKGVERGESKGDGGKTTQYDQSVTMKRVLRSFLQDTDKTPRELVFLGRNMRIVQGNNQALGSPVNRIKIMGLWATRAVSNSSSSSSPSYSFFSSSLSTTSNTSALSVALGRLTSHLRLLSSLLILDISFHLIRLRQILSRTWVGQRVFGLSHSTRRGGRGGSGMSDESIGGNGFESGGMGGGFEDEVERQMQGYAKDTFGVEVKGEMFNG